jgi:hypothetical protein
MICFFEDEYEDDDEDEILYALSSSSSYSSSSSAVYKVPIESNNRHLHRCIKKRKTAKSQRPEAK